MHFGDNVREIVSMSCRADLRAARSRTPLPGIDSPEVQRRLAADLERSFGITLSPEDVTHLTTVRAVLQCVRLRRWERDVALQAPTAASAPANAAAVKPLRERLVRYTAPVPALPLPASPTFVARKS
ncbi:MAG: hypothetical protein B6D46_05210 [Polyangiaceae bacterium UTPRO1]|jgi:acyl carrier protein|nr:hypothetical protein [Myxococcales bacterium]OQY67951.1 MAG: hypothetical protein B6D46_05210 [Polyangiaceae bacterium UTPRO1]